MPFESSIKVGVRSRPLVYNEVSEGCGSIIDFQSDNIHEIVLGKTKLFSFDYSFSEQCSQKFIYDTAVCDMIQNLFVGYNVTVLAYGQTGSGKTYTMGTNCKEIDVNDTTGIIPRAIKDIFLYLDTVRVNSEINVKVSFIEIYNEEIYDLLSPNKDVRQIREENQDVKIPNLTEIKVSTASEVYDLLMKGAEIRVVGSTAMNDTSSRSHAIFTVQLNINPLIEGDFEAVYAKLHLVDLAGSERASKTLATGERFKEGININKGLLVLGNVISSLVEREKKGKIVHIPYRESKLTRILQDSLGGNTKTLMIACISPADSNFDETSTTLQYAARARQIQNRPVVNKVDPSANEIHKLRAMVSALKDELRVNQGGSVPVAVQPNDKLCLELYQKNDAILNLKKEKLQLEYDHEKEISKFVEFVKVLHGKLNDKGDIDESCEIQTIYNNLMQNYVDKDSEDLDNNLNTSGVSTPRINDTLLNLQNELQNKEYDLQYRERELTALHDYEEKKREYEQRIRDLEERKLSASSINKVDLERQLREVRRQVAQLIELKEKKTQEVQSLKQKIQDLKANIVRVEKEVKKERFQHKKELADSKKQCVVMEMKDRKLQTEMQKQAAKHAKETAVLKRRFESSLAVEKRLKEILNRQKVNHLKVARKIRDVNKNVRNWINECLDHVSNQVKLTDDYEKQLQDRADINTKIRKVISTLENGDEPQKIKLANLEEQLNEINDVMEKIQNTILENVISGNGRDGEVQGSNFGVVLNNIWNQLKNISDCRATIRYLFKNLMQEKVKNSIYQMNLDDREKELLNFKECCLKFSEERMRIRKTRRMSAFFENKQETEPNEKKQRTTDVISDTDSINSKQSLRVSSSCKCKSVCNPKRCGCIKTGENCGFRCSCKGLCNDSTRQLTSIEESPDKENVMDRTFILTEKNENQINIDTSLT